MAFCARFGGCETFEFFGEGDIVEECPGIIELVVPCSLQISHRLHHAIHLLIANQRQESRIDACCS